MTDKKVERPGGLKGLWSGFKETIYGMAAHDMSRAALRTRACMEHLFILITMGDMLGMPILPPYYTLGFSLTSSRRSRPGSGGCCARRTYPMPCSNARAGRHQDIEREELNGDERGFSSRTPDRRYIMFGGKGGLGKTTFSAAAAYWLATQGKRVLVFSVDPQASLSDIFQRDIFGKGPVKIMANLFAQEIDADQRIKAYQGEIRKKILDMYGFDKSRTRSKTTSRQPPPSRPWKRARSSTRWWTSSSPGSTTTTSTTWCPLGMRCIT